MSSTVDVQFLRRTMQHVLEEMRHIRKETGDIRASSLQTYEFSRRLERRQSEPRDDLELTVKMELGGATANLQTVLEASIHRIEDTIDALADRLEVAGSNRL